MKQDIKIKYNMKSAKKKKYIKIKIFQSLDACSKFFTTLIKQSPNILYCIHKNYQKYLKEHHLIFQHSRKYFLENQFPVKEHQFQEAHFDS